jgi:hypothetical protein
MVYRVHQQISSVPKINQAPPVTQTAMTRQSTAANSVIPVDGFPNTGISHVPASV